VILAAIQSLPVTKREVLILRDLEGLAATGVGGEHTDLFWGIRGGGGNFGIVTQFECRLHPLGPIVLAGLALWPMDRASDVVRAWRDYVDGAPDELSTACAILTAPPVVDLIQPMPYTAFQALLDTTAPKGHRSYWRGE
jgi:FAD/FMN-containing dehydrogenase